MSAHQTFPPGPWERRAVYTLAILSVQQVQYPIGHKLISCPLDARFIEEPQLCLALIVLTQVTLFQGNPRVYFIDLYRELVPYPLYLHQ